MKIHLAGPLFTESQQDWMGGLKNDIESLGRPVNVVWPYDLITKSEIEALGDQANFEIFSRCKSHLDDTDMLISLLDGPQVDDGTAWETGYFFARKRRGQTIIGIRTDFRRAGESEFATVNAMIEVACDLIVRSRQEVLGAVLESLGG
jgi:nucleoside 2-deoxyribosyltransferase